MPKPKVIDSYTASIITVHLKKDFTLSLSVPTDDDIQRIKNEYSLKKAKIDDDNDFMASGGEIAKNKIIKGLGMVMSKEAIQIKLLGATTDDCFDLLYNSIAILYGKNASQMDGGIKYVDYETTTKVQLDKPIYSVYSDAMKNLISSWKNLDSGALIGVINDGESFKSKSKGVVDLNSEEYNRLYQGQSSGLVVPSAIQFNISIPTNYYKLSHHKVSITVESVEDFQENIYFVQTKFPYKAHLELIDLIAGHDVNKALKPTA
ncbi:MAG: hypothetical protein ACQETL_19875 [Bacteroidota bacterium]